ncbi:MAG: hypothetical protein IT457_23880 [Planctomycetes bacterium]|nr:hypothetical protein [Planctomycetota bacterium]
MLALFALCVVAVPQDSDPLELLRAVQRQIDAQTIAVAAEKILLEASPNRVPGFRTPPFAGLLRGDAVAGLGALRARFARAADQGPPTAPELLERLAELGGTAAAIEARAPLDLAAFENLVSATHRDLVQAIGSGREPDRVVPSLRAAIDAVRARTENLGAIADDDVSVLRERLARLAKYEESRVQRLGLELLGACLRVASEGAAERLARGTTSAPRGDMIVLGEVLADREAGFGRFVVGGPGRNVYDCTQLDVIVDVGGDDEYRGPAGGAGDRSRLAIVIDLSGNDRYLGGNDALGSASLGIGILIDAAGDDEYRAEARSAGFALAGFGACVDLAGADRYELGDLSAGVAIAGTACFADLGGDDRLRAGVESFGVGLPGGLGVHFDGGGNDARRAGRVTKHVLEGGAIEVSGAFGVGLGAPPLLAPGCGVFVDFAGDDRNDAAAIAFGVGGRGGVGAYVDLRGDDSLLAGDLALGAAYGRGLGYCVDETGDDTRSAGRYALGAAMDESVALAFDGAGDDRSVVRGPALGIALRLAAAACLDLGGRDVWSFDQDGAPPRIADLRAAAGAAIGVFLDIGGAQDRYEFHGIVAPENARTRMQSEGAGETLTKQVFVDR